MDYRIDTSNIGSREWTGRVITYGNGGPRKANLTPSQAAALERAGRWIRDEHGELCCVEHGSHRGPLSFTGLELQALIHGEEVHGVVAR